MVNLQITEQETPFIHQPHNIINQLLKDCKEQCRILQQLELFKKSAIELVTPDFKDWIYISNEIGHENLNKFKEECQKVNKHLSIKLQIDKYNIIGEVNLYTLNEDKQLYIILKALIDNAVQFTQISIEEQGFLEELSFSWESLETIYEVSSLTETILNETEALQLIIKRATFFQHGIKALLWLDREGEFELIGSDDNYNNNEQYKSWEKGVLKTLKENHEAIVINGKEQIKEINDLEEVFSNATSIVAVPIHKRNVSVDIKGAITGAITIWKEKNQQHFDSRIVFALNSLAAIASLVIDNNSLYREFINKERLQQEIGIGFKIQQTLLLGTPPKEHTSFEIETLAIPSKNISGDFYDFFNHNEKCVDLVVGDVMGKGVPAALVGAGIKSRLLRFSNEGIKVNSNYKLAPPESIITKVHKEITPKLIDLQTFATICYARFDLVSQKLIYVNCGHTKSLHYHNGNIEKLPGNNFPLGVFEKARFKQSEVDLNLNDIFLLYSDGVTEAKNEEDELFGVERICEILKQNATNSCKEILQKLKRAVSEFSHQEYFNDDLTCVIIRVKHITSKIRCCKILEIHNKLSELRKVQNFIKENCVNISQLNNQEKYNLCLAVNEIISNIIRHGYAKDIDGIIRMELFVSATGIKIFFIDQGIHFVFPSKDNILDISKIETRRLRQMEHGFGLYLIHQLVDEVKYIQDSYGNNKLYIVKKFNENQF